MVLRRILLYPFALIYGGILELRNSFYNLGILKISKVDVPVISIGNLSMGGTGKTPHVNYLVEYLKQQKNVGVLLRGYGRKSKGVIRVTPNAAAETVGDEALLYKKRHKDTIEVVVAEKRIEGAQQLLNAKKKTEIIVLDDAYQHRSIDRDLNILLVDLNRPYWKDFVLPAGNLREFAFQKKRADVIIVTKCPLELTNTEKERIIKKIKPLVHQAVYFSSIIYGDFLPFHQHEFGLPEQILLITGIANAHPLKNHLEKIAQVTHLSFPDHYDYNSKDIQEIHELFDKFASSDKVIVTTEKDYVRLMSSGHQSSLKNFPWFYKEITVEIDRGQELLNRIKKL